MPWERTAASLARLAQYKINFMDKDNNIIHTFYVTYDGIRTSVLQTELEKFPDTASLDVLHVKHATGDYVEPLLEQNYILHFDKTKEVIDLEEIEMQKMKNNIENMEEE